MNCELCDTIDWEEGEIFKVVECKTCHIPMFVLREHRQFTELEKTFIHYYFARKYYPDKIIRWEQRRIKDHAHCHFE